MFYICRTMCQLDVYRSHWTTRKLITIALALNKAAVAISFGLCEGSFCDACVRKHEKPLMCLVTNIACNDNLASVMLLLYLNQSGLLLQINIDNVGFNSSNVTFESVLSMIYSKVIKIASFFDNLNQYGYL